MPAKTRSMAKLEAENVTERTNNNAAPVANVTSKSAAMCILTAVC